MSYCRWSSDNFNCDVYAYESCYGVFDIHVAKSRIVGDVPKVDHNLLFEGKADEFMRQNKIQSDFLETCKTEPIGLQYDGESFNEPDLQSFLERMIELKEIGYRIPDYVFDIIKDEINEDKQGR